MKQRKSGPILGWLVLVFALSACAGLVEKGKKPSDDWSRGVPLGDTARGSLGVTVEPDGSRIHLAWPYLADTGVRVRYVQIRPDGQLLLERKLDLPYLRNRAPRLIPAGEDRLHLVLASRPDREGGWELWYLPLDRMDGSPLAEPRRVSEPEARVGSYDVVSDGAGGVILVWEQEATDGVVGLRLGVDGQLLSEPEPIASPASSPSARIDENGMVHLAWIAGEAVRYASVSDFPSPAGSVTSVAEITRGTGDSVYGPTLGLSADWAYVFWSLLSRSGLEAGTARTSYVSFPIGSPEQASNAQRLFILPLEELPYETYEGEYSLTQLVRFGSAGANSDFVYEPITLEEQRQELAVGFSVNQAFRQDVHVQIALAVFSEGQLRGYSMAGKTDGLSGEPIVAVDEAANFYVLWREGAVGERVFYSTTAPRARAGIDRLGFDDLLSTVLLGGMEGLATVLLFPLATPWLIPGFILLIVWKIYRDQESLSERSSWVVLIVAIVLYQGTKLVFFPTFLTYVPFSAWVDVPPGWSIGLRAGVPLFILLFAIAVAELARRRSSSTFLYFSLVALIDMVLTLAVYGVNFLGVF